MRKHVVLILIMIATIHGSTAYAVFVSSTTVSAPTIDGVLGAGEWGTGCTVTMNRHDGGAQHDSIIYFQHDTNYLYVGVDSGWGSGWDIYWKLFIDGDNNGNINGNLNEPHIDISCDYQSPGGWSGYNTYWAHTQANPGGLTVANPSGALRASDGSSNIIYEFQIPLADLGIQQGDSIGFGARLGTDGTAAHGYISAPGIGEGLYDYSQLDTLQLIPEPATLLLFGLGGIVLRQRVKK